MSVREVYEPFIKNKVEIKISVVGICGSDVLYYFEGKIGSLVVQDPFPVGYECSGTIVFWDVPANLTDV